MQTLTQVCLQHFQSHPHSLLLEPQCFIAMIDDALLKERSLHWTAVIPVSWGPEVLGSLKTFKLAHIALWVGVFFWVTWCFCQLLWTAYISKCYFNTSPNHCNLHPHRLNYLKLQPAPFSNKAIALAVVSVKSSSTYLLFCTSVSNKCLEMKMYSTPSLSWLLLGRVVSAVSLNEQQQQKKEKKHKTT